jgi:hypothetical protein
MTVLIIPNEFDIFSSLRTFLTANLPSTVDVIRGQVNRVPEPKGPDFVVMTALRKERLETNVDTYADVLFNATVVGGTMTVDSVFYGVLELGSAIFGVDAPSGMTITALGTGTGSVGTYSVSPQANLSSRHLAAGTQKMMQPVEVTIQLDVHGPNGADNAFRISTVFRDEYATTAFASYGKDVTPLYADDPKQVPFINDQNQYEDRWVLEACLQANQAVVNIPQQFFETAVVGLIEVDSHYPP